MWEGVPRQIQTTAPAVGKQIADNNPRRAWLLVQNISGEACTLTLWRGGLDYGIVRLEVGDDAKFEPGDMWWDGAVIAISPGGTAVIYGTEMTWVKR